MKQLFFLLAFLPLAAAAQDCSIKKEADQFTQLPKLTTGFIPFAEGSKRFLLSVDATKTEIDFFVALNNGSEGKCFNDASTAQVFYEGSKLKATFKNTGSMNCEGLFHFSFRNVATTPSALQRLATQKITGITLLDTNKKEIKLEFTPAEQQMLMERVGCLIKESKSLL